MQHHEIVATFERVFKGQPNFMTPEVIGYGQRGDFIFECSEGRGIEQERIFGLTILDLEGTNYPEYSGMYNTRAGVNNAVADLSNKDILPIT